MAFPSDSLPALTGSRPSSGPEGPPPARARRRKCCAASACECAGAAAGRAGWTARPPGSSPRTGSDCRQRRSPASARDSPGRSPAGYLWPHGNKSKQRGKRTGLTGQAARRNVRRTWAAGSWSRTRRCRQKLAPPSLPFCLLTSTVEATWPHRGWL